MAKLGILLLSLCLSLSDAQEFSCFTSNDCRGTSVEPVALETTSDCCAGLGLSYNSAGGCSNCFSEEEFVSEGEAYSLAAFNNINVGAFFQYGRIRISVCPINVETAAFSVRTTPSDVDQRTDRFMAPTVFTVAGSQRLTNSGERDKRIRVMADNGQQLSVIALAEEFTSSDAFKVLPIVNLPNEGYEFYGVSVSITQVEIVDMNETLPLDPSGNSVMILVTNEPNTVLTITSTTAIDISAAVDNDLKELTGTDVLLPGVPLTIAFQRAGQTLYLGSRSDITGSKVVSNKPIAFFSGHECGTVPSELLFCDQMVEQIPPTSTWGKRFITVPFANRNGFDFFKVIASRDNTIISSMCNNNSRNADIFLDSGEVEEFTITSDDFCYFESTNPVLLVQFSVASRVDDAEGDPFMVMLPPVEQYRNSYIITAFPAPSDLPFLPVGTHYVNILLPVESDPASVIYDGEFLPSELFSPIPCIDNVEAVCAYGAQMENISTGDHTVLHNDNAPLNVVVYWHAARVAQGYPGGMTQRPIALPAVIFTFDEFVSLENETAVEIQLTRSGDLSNVARVTIRTSEVNDRAEQTAQAGEDFEMLDTTVEFAEGVTEQVVIVNLVDDVFPESDEVFEVYLAVSPGVYISRPFNATVFILNDDPPLPVMNVSFVDTDLVVREGEGFVSFSLSKTEGAIGPVSVQVTTEAGSATSFDDYEFLNTEVTFEIADLDVNVSVRIFDNMQVEEDEEFIISIQPIEGFFPVNVVDSEAVVTIEDNDVLVIGFASVNYVVSEEESVEVTVDILSGSLQTNLVLEVSFLNDTAQDSDVALPSTMSLTFGPGTPRRQVLPIGIVDDPEVEETETFLLTLDLGSEVETREIVLAPQLVQVTIEDNDEAAIVLSAVGQQAVEGGVSARVRVSVEGTLGAPVEIGLRTFNQNATAGVDYIGVDSMVVTLTNESSSQEVVIGILDDGIYEGPYTESFIAQICLLSGDNNGITIGQSTVELFIVDNEPRPVPRIGFMQTVYSVVESSRAVLVLLESDGVNPQPVNVSYTTTAGSAESEDFRNFNGGTITFLPGSTLESATVPIVNDGISEQTESFTLELQSGTDFDISQGTTEIRIQDDDSVVVGFSIIQYTVRENVAQVSISIDRSTEISVPVSVLFCTLPATASESTDFIAQNDQVITFQPDSPPVQQVQVDIVNDVINEGDEVFIVQLEQSPGETLPVTIEEPLASVTIQDDDPAATLRIAFIQGVYVFDEDVPTAVVEIELSEASVDPITVLVSTLDGSADENDDFRPLDSLSVTFAPLNTLQIVVLEIFSDDTLEQDEDFSLLLVSNTTGANLDTATVIIRNDDRVSLALVEPSPVTESEAAVLEVQLRGRTEIPVIANIETQDGSAIAPGDYGAVSLPIAFVPGEDVVRVSIAVHFDSLVEETESFFVALSSSQEAVTVAQDSATVIVQDFTPVNLCDSNPCDANAVCSSTCGSFVCSCLPSFSGDGFTCVPAAPEARFNPTTYTVTEGEVVELIVELVGQSLEPIEVEVFLVNDTASAPFDYVDVSQRITFCPGQGTRVFNIQVQTNEDSLIEGNEQFTAVLIGDIVVLDSEATVIIIDLPPLPDVGFERSMYNVTEGDRFVEVCVVVEKGELDLVFSVRITTTDVTAQGISNLYPYNFGSDTSFDDVVDSFAFVGTLTTPYLLYGNSYQSVFVGSNGQVSFREGTGRFDIHFPTTPPLVTAFWADINPIIGGTIFHRVINSGPELEDLSTNLSGFQCEQFEPTSAAVVTFERVSRFGGSSDIHNTFQVILMTNGTTSYSVFLYGSMNWGMQRVLVGFNDGTNFYSLAGGAGSSLRTPDATVLQFSSNVGVDGVFVFRTDSTIQDGVQCPMQAFGDYLAVDASLTLTVRSRRACENITIVNDTIVEQDETFIVNIVSIRPNTYVSRTSCTVLIRDDDRVTIGFQLLEYSSNENSVVEVCAIITEGSLQEREVTVRISTEADTATSGLDYASVADIELIFNADTDRVCIALEILGDDIFEGEEEFFARLTTDNPDVTLDPDTTTITIEDIGVITVRFAQPSYTFVENELSGEVEVIRNGDSIVPISVRVFGGPSTSLNIMQSADPVDTIVTFPRGVNSVFVDVLLTDDNIGLEDVEVFPLSLERLSITPSSVEFASPSVTTINIIDNDITAVRFNPTTYTVTEGEVVELIVELVGQSLVPIEVEVFLVNDTASAPFDYVDVSQRITFSPGQGTRVFNIQVQTNEDILLEGNEQFTAVLIGDIVVLDSVATVIIIDLPVLPVPPVASAMQPDPVNLGATIELACVATNGTPPLTFTWTRDSDGMEVFSSTASGVYSFTVASDNTGLYTCNITNPLGSNTTSVNVVLGIAPTVSAAQSQVVQLVVGANLTLAVDITGFNQPLTAVTWRRGATVINATARVTIINSDLSIAPATSMLTVSPVMSPSADEGTYIVTAESPAGTSDIGFDVNVFAPPTITDPQGDVTVNESASISLKCTARGFPAPSFVWLQGTTELMDGLPRITIVTSSFNPDAEGFRMVISILSISSANCSDAGSYACVASNNEPGLFNGEDRSNFTITVNCVVALESSMYNVTEGDPFVEVCVVVEEGELDLVLSVGITTTDITAQGISNLYTYNFGIDASFDDRDDSFAFVGTLTTPYLLYRNSYQSVFVGSNGQVSFGEGTSSFDIIFPTTPPLVTAFSADIDPIVGGTIFHRVINSGPELEDLSTNLRGFQCEQFEPTSAAVITFERVSRFSGSSDIHNTFQVILLTNGTTSYSVFLYGSMNWGTLVLIGFNDGTDFYSLAGGANSSLRTLDATVLQFSSNVGVDGVFVFRTDSTIQDGVQCPMQAFGDYLAVDASLTLTARSRRACERITIVNDTIVEQDETFIVNIVSIGPNTIVSRASTTVLIRDNDDLVVYEFEEATYTTEEGSRGVLVCVVATTATALRIVVTVRSEEKPDSLNPATAGVDFGAEERSTTGVGRICFIFRIFNDSIVEGDEQFRVVFSNLPTNQIGRTSEACVTILDDECTDGDLRLRDGTNQFEGRVEVCLNGVFGTVCDDGWGITDGDVVCGLLFGREYLSEVCPSVEECFGPGTGPIHLDNVECNGSESSLLDCTFDDDTSDCSHREDAGVMCLLFA